VTYFLDTATVTAFKAAWAVTGHLPAGTAQSFFRRIADRAYKRNGSSVRQMRKNYSRVQPDASAAQLDDLTRAGLRSYYRYWCDAFRLPSMSSAQILDSLTVVGSDHLLEPLSRGAGVLAIAPHSGNWDLTGAFAARSYRPVTTVAEKLEPRKLFDEFTKHRVKHGIKILATGEAGNLDCMSDQLDQGNIVALMGDRDISRKGIPVDFFGSVAKLPAGPALLSLRTGVPVYPTHMFYTNGKATTQFCEPLPMPSESLPIDDRVAALTQSIADALATGIKDNLEHWHMMQPLWIDDLRVDGRRG